MGKFNIGRNGIFIRTRILEIIKIVIEYESLLQRGI